MDNENKKDNTVINTKGFGRKGHGMENPPEKAKDFKSAISRLFKELKNYKVTIMIAIILAVGSSILSILAPNRLSNLTDEVQAGLVIKPSINIDAVKTIIITLAALYICSAIFSYIQSVCMANVSNKFAKQLRTRISSKINKLPLKYFDKHQIRRYFIKSYKRC